MTYLKSYLTVPLKYIVCDMMYGGGGVGDGWVRSTFLGGIIVVNGEFKGVGGGVAVGNGA